MKLMITAALLFLSYICFAQKDTLYFDDYGLRVNKNAAKHYRPPYTKEGEKYKVVEYSMNGQLLEEATLVLLIP